jgi:hypothetical protein
MSLNLGASTSWNPQGLSRPVMGLLCLHFKNNSVEGLIFVTDFLLHSFLLFKLKDTENTPVGYSVYIECYKICLLLSSERLFSFRLPNAYANTHSHMVALKVHTGTSGRRFIFPAPNGPV